MAGSGVSRHGFFMAISEQGLSIEAFDPDGQTFDRIAVVN